MGCEGDGEFQRSSTHHERRAQKLGSCPVPGLSCCRVALADRALHSACPAGSNVGGDRSSTADRAPLWSDPGIDRPCFRRSHQVDGLGAPSRCARALCRDCRARRTAAPAIHHEKNGKDTSLGVCLFAHRARTDFAILGSADRATLTRSLVCIPSAAKRFRNTLAAKQSIGAVVGGLPTCPPVYFLHFGPDQGVYRIRPTGGEEERVTDLKEMLAALVK